VEVEGAPGAQLPEKKKKTLFRILTKDGRFEKVITAEGKTTMVIPRNRTLRDRGTLKKPERYTAHFASFCEEPGSSKEAMQSKDKDCWVKAMEKGTLIACVVLCAGAGTAFGLAVSNNKQAEQMLILLKLP
jgi:hypothetical protein